MGLILSTDYFGNSPGRILIKFNNGTDVVDGYIVNQTGTRRYTVSQFGDDTNTIYKVMLARTVEDAYNLKPGLATIQVFPFLNGKISEIPEHIHRIEQFVCFTVEGHRYGWKFGTHIFPPNPAWREGAANISQIPDKI